MNRHKLGRPLVLTALIGCFLTFVARAQTAGCVETNVVVSKQVGTQPALVDSNGVAHIARFFDPNLVNPLRITESSTSGACPAMRTNKRARKTRAHDQDIKETT